MNFVLESIKMIQDSDPRFSAWVPTHVSPDQREFVQRNASALCRQAEGVLDPLRAQVAIPKIVRFYLP